ncbi:hypothetical protein [Virgibacillus proomii]|uniref:hypothetical protein n=1 Tax=Virgibacillus proomii TaxID=84407 RepID=UPI001C10A503|nr:hypothetical protein [Virgibacillus proomii]MBU5266354.1 hypothetical protein [Virgibacillus proomii]
MHAEKAYFFFKDKKSYDSNTSHAEKAYFFFKDKKSYDSNTSHAEKAYFFSRTRKTSTPIHYDLVCLFPF